MKVIWGKFGTGVDLILCVIINYYVVSIWVNGKDEFHAYSLKTSIIFLIEVMLVLNMGKTDRSDRYQRRKYRKAQSIPLSCLLCHRQPLLRSGIVQIPLRRQL